jgi:hypothetical protein
MVRFLKLDGVGPLRRRAVLLLVRVEERRDEDRSVVSFPRLNAMPLK